MMLRDIIAGISISLMCNASALAETPLEMAEPDARALLGQSCQSCHSLKLIEQQRLTATQWEATILKMRNWGAIIAESEMQPLALALAKWRGPDAALPIFERRRTTLAAAEWLPTPAGTYANGRPMNGKKIYVARCMACHGEKAAGHIGVNLVDRPFLDQPARLHETLRVGRGRMPPQPDLTIANVSDLITYLSTLSVVQ